MPTILPPVLEKPCTRAHIAGFLDVHEQVSLLHVIQGAIDLASIGTTVHSFWPLSDTSNPAGPCRDRVSQLERRLRSAESSLASAEHITRLLSDELDTERRKNERLKYNLRQMRWELDEARDNLVNAKKVARTMYEQSLSKCTRPACENFERPYNPNDPQPHGFDKCSKCHMAKYCSRECQAEDWAHHKRKCTKWLSSRGFNLANDDAHDLHDGDEDEGDTDDDATDRAVEDDNVLPDRRGAFRHGVIDDTRYTANERVGIDLFLRAANGAEEEDETDGEDLPDLIDDPRIVD